MVFQEVSQIALVDVVLPTRNGVSIRKRCVAKPHDHEAILLLCLGLQLLSSLRKVDL